jgi:hypothetical protein
MTSDTSHPSKDVGFISKKRRRGEVERLSSERLYAALDSAISSQDSTELAFLQLINDFEFDKDVFMKRLKGPWFAYLSKRSLWQTKFLLLTRFLAEKGLSLNLSKVTYAKIAPFVGLDPLAKFRDVSNFELHRARIPTSLFQDIVRDMEVMMQQYGPPDGHQNEEARSRFLAPVCVMK